MPHGILLMKWDLRAGVSTLAHYPTDIEVSMKTLMQVYSTHEFNKEAGTIQLMDGSLNMLSYYSGEPDGYYLILFLKFDEDSDEYEGALADAMRVILQNFDDQKYISLLPSLYQRISTYPTLSFEQRLATIYHDELKRHIINRLREECISFKSEIKIWLHDIYSRMHENIDQILDDLIKLGIIKETSVKGISTDLIFLINDLIILRIPPEKLLKNPTASGLPVELKEKYIAKCKNFFSNYRPTEEDHLFLELLMDSSSYEVLRLLRIAIVTRNELEKLKKKGVDDIDSVLNNLISSGVVDVFIDSQENQYYALITDIHIELIFPKYQLNILRETYNSKSKAKKVLLEYCSVLKNTYLDVTNPDKKKKKKSKRK